MTQQASLSRLHGPLLARIVGFVAAGDPTLVPALLTDCGRTLYEATRAHQYGHVTLEDDDRLLLLGRPYAPNQDDEAEELAAYDEGETGALSTRSNLLSTVMSSDDYARCVQALSIVDPLHHHGTMSAPLDELGLVGVLQRLAMLRTFVWDASRAPPVGLGSALGSLPLVRLSITLPQPAVGETTGEMPTPDSPDAASALEAVKPLRWDGELLAALPSSVVQLRLGNLSADGVRALTRALGDLPSLAEVTLESSLFVDDALVGALGRECRKLVRLGLRAINGTKLTDRGLAELFEASSSLEALELREVEGRLSRTCWTKITFGPFFRELRVSYSEAGSHHSWVCDHLHSIEAALDNSSLRTFSVTRLVPHAALEPGQHARVALAPLAQPSRIPTSLGQKLVERVGQLEVLECDWWETSFDFLKAMLESGKALTRIQCLLDAPFAKALDITSNMQHLRSLVLSIPPRHTPGLQSFGTITYIDSSPTTATSNLPASVSPVKKSPIATMTGVSGTSPVLAIMLAAIPPVKDVKRFLRKMPRLVSIEWTGRGAVGSWSIRRTSNSVLAVPKIEFTPIHELLERSHATSRPAGQLASRGLDLSTAPTRPPGRSRSYTQSSSGFTNTDSIFDTSGHGASSTSPSAPETPEGLKLEGMSFGAFGSGEAGHEPVSPAAGRRSGGGAGVIGGGGRRASADTSQSPKSPTMSGRKRMASNPGLSLPASAPPPSVPEIKTVWGNAGGSGGRARQPSAGAGTTPSVTPGRRTSNAKTSPTTATTATKDEPLSPTKASSGSSNHNRRQSRSGGAARK